MANYILNRTDPLSPSVTVDAGRANGPGNALSSTTLRMYGEGYPNWGEAVNENFVKLIESFASATPPINPLVGQLWYQVQLYQHDTSQADGAGWWVYSSSLASWSMLNGTGVVATSATPPVSPSSGDYYYNTTDSKLYWWTQLYGQSELMWLDRATSMVNLSGGAPSSTPSQTLMIYTSGGTWSTVALAIVDGTAPSAPAAGTLWYDTALDTLRVWDGTSWNTLVNGDNPTLSGDLDMNGNLIINVGNAVNPTDALNQQTGDARYVNVGGDSMTGTLEVQPATLPTHAPQYQQVQPIDPTLTALAGVTTAADTLIYADGVDSFTGMPFDAAARLLLTSMTFSGKYAEKVNAVGNATGAVTVDGNAGTYVTATITGATTFTFTNPAPTGYLSGFVFEVTNGGAFAITWPAGTKWSNGTAPTLTTAGIDLLVFTTIDGGTTWRGNLIQKDSK